jgi:hypothetical protein
LHHTNIHARGVEVTWRSVSAGAVVLMTASPSGELRSSKLFSILYTPFIKVLNLIISNSKTARHVSHTRACAQTHTQRGGGMGGREKQKRGERRMSVHTRHTRPILLAKLVEIKGDKDIELLFCQTCWPAPPDHGLCLLQTQYPLHAHATIRVRTQTQSHTDTHSPTFSLIHAL